MRDPTGPHGYHRKEADGNDVDEDAAVGPSWTCAEHRVMKHRWRRCTAPAEPGQDESGTVVTGGRALPSFKGRNALRVQRMLIFG